MSSVKAVFGKGVIMTTFQLLLIIVLAVIAFAAVWAIVSKKGITFNYNKTVTTVNKMDEFQLELAKQNLEELKKYNANASKQTMETSQALRTMTTAVQDLMGVNDEQAKQ